MSDQDEHLTAEQVARILEIVQDMDAIVVGGQSVNLWAAHYARLHPDLARKGPFTSKDIDFYAGIDAATALAEALGGELYVPELDDATPNTAIFVGKLGDRQVEIDFMRTVLGVEDKSIRNNCVTLRGRNPSNGQFYRLLLLHPLDCLRSRLANVNTLRREDELSLRQARVAIKVLQLFIDEELQRGHWRSAQSDLHDLFYIARDAFVRAPIARRHDLNPLPIMSAFVDHTGLDERWRSFILARNIERLDDMLRRAPSEAPEPEPAPHRP